MIKYARLTSAHPGFIYLIFHGMAFTTRLLSVMSGSPTLFSNWPGAIPLSDQEIAQAGLWSDFALVAITVGLILASQRDCRRTMTQSMTNADGQGAFLSERVVLFVSAVAFPIGIVSLLVNGAVPNMQDMTVNFGEWGTSSWLMISQFWPVLVLLALVYFYGFRWKLMVPTGVFLVLMAIQGFNRFRVIIPVIFLLITWQTRAGRKWPRKWMVVTLLCLAMLAFPMKKLGRMVQKGLPFSDLAEVASASFSESLRGQAPDQMFLDMFAATMWLVDDSSRYFYGTTVYPLLFLPVPRQLWPEKPEVSTYLYEIRNPVRPIYWGGMGGTMLGEAYANFGVIGIALVPGVMGYFLARFYFAAMRHRYFSVYRFMYVIVASCLVQVYRDGLQSLVIFPLVDMMPLAAIAILSCVSLRRKRGRDFVSPAFAPGRARGVTRSSV
jgi:hypothetical protein